ncbi:hypothetical protein [Syntrophus gentianae]|uniref:hypothetical protein n=1 Tax=Syntrophus gentianae TaxID=43775 RepID=UPI000B88A964|nr:hypothetical protein [Syntrophus gentianae]
MATSTLSCFPNALQFSEIANEYEFPPMLPSSPLALREIRRPVPCQLFWLAFISLYVKNQTVNGDEMHFWLKGITLIELVLKV